MKELLGREEPRPETLQFFTPINLKSNPIAAPCDGGGGCGGGGFPG